MSEESSSTIDSISESDVSKANNNESGFAQTSSVGSLFKKRGKANLNLRKKSTEIGSKPTEESGKLENDDADDKGINRDVLQDFQAYQNSKSRHTGVTLDALARGATKTKEKKRDEEKPTTVSTLLGAFSVHVDNGIQTVATPHVDIMEKYVNEKLNIPTEESINAAEKFKKPKMDQELYEIPAHLQVEPIQLANDKKEKSQVRMEEEGVISSWSTGIAEVELPIAYKLKNIEATEEATKSKLLNDEEIRLIRQSMQYSSTNHPTTYASSAKHLHQFPQHQHLSSSQQAQQAGFQRFQIVDRSIPKHLFDYSLSQFVNNDESLQQSLLTHNQQEVPSVEELQRAQQQKRPQQSTDDIVMQNFRKRKLK